MEFDLENHSLSSSSSSDLIESLFTSETNHIPSQNYINILKTTDFRNSIRLQAISLILQFTKKFDPITSYLAVNYLDRFISMKEMKHQDKPWFVRLISVSCISLALKMKKIEFSLVDLQGEVDGYAFDSETIQRTELLILGDLNWRMRSITPFSFFSFFISFFKLKDLSLQKSLRSKATEIITKSLPEISLLEFKSSIIAASALLSACEELFPLEFLCFQTEISSCSYVNNDKLLNCCNLMKNIVKESSAN